MKSSVIAMAGLLAAAALALPAMGCKITHYVPANAPVDPAGEARCNAMCDQLAEDEAIPSSSLRACHAACKSPAPVVVAKAADTRAAENACSKDAEDRADAPPPERPTASCQCKKGDRCGHCRPAAPPPRACQDDSDCPDDAACQSGTCK